MNEKTKRAGEAELLALAVPRGIREIFFQDWEAVTMQEWREWISRPAVLQMSAMLCGACLDWNKSLRAKKERT